ncbi:MAG: aminotransferase class V-fold PLP-dependent enzyme [archaeon]
MRVIFPKYMHEYSAEDFLTSFNGIFHDYEPDLRHRLSRVFRNDRILFLDSGRSALDLIFKHLNLPEGSEVAIPVNVCHVVVEVILSNKLKPLLIDIDDNLTLSVPDLRRKLSKKTRVVIPVHAFGNVCDMDSVMGLAKSKNLVVIEDAAQTFDASFKNKVVCSFADYSFISLDVTKHLSSFGGGILITKDDSFYKKTRFFLDHRQGVGFSVLLKFLAFNFLSSSLVYSLFTKHFVKRIKQLSYYRPKDRKLSRVGLALAFSQVKKLALVDKVRKTNADKFVFNLGGDVKFYTSTKDRNPSYLFLPVEVSNPRKVESFLLRNFVDLPKAPPLLVSLPRYRSYYSKCPKAEGIYSSMILLPTYRRIGSRVGVISRSIMHINRS